MANINRMAKERLGYPTHPLLCMNVIKASSNKMNMRAVERPLTQQLGRAWHRHWTRRSDKRDKGVYDRHGLEHDRDYQLITE